MQLITLAVSFKILPCTLPSMQKVLQTVVSAVLQLQSSTWWQAMSEYAMWSHHNVCGEHTVIIYADYSSPTSPPKTVGWSEICPLVLVTPDAYYGGGPP